MTAGGEKQDRQPYKYGNKELDEMNGLNLYDFLARGYDPAIGRFMSIDPLAEKYPWMSPYAYCGNNPITRVDKDGREWTYIESANGQATINLSLIFSVSGNYTAEQINAYKNAISTQFHNTISGASGGTMSGTVTFYAGNENITQSLSLGEMDGSIGGMTSFFNSSVNLVNRAGELKPLSDIGADATHEVLHTLRLDHPFEITQTEDTKLLRVAPNSFVSTSTTDANIVNNVMNYPMITIDGAKGTNQTFLTKGQLNFMLKEINLQGQGYGFVPKYNSALTPEQNANLYKQYYENYWFNIPGTPVGNQ
jgi:RHS repeat-associated protein